MVENSRHIKPEPTGYKLPKKLHGSDEGSKIIQLLLDRLKPAGPCSEYLMPLFKFTIHIKDALNSARRTGRLVRGMEEAEKILDAERSGILSADMKTGSKRVERISRLIVVANDGSSRFYRQIKKMVERNKPRVMAVELDVSSFELGEALFGPGKRALFILVNHKDAVVNALKSFIIQSS
ncbi:MAG: hypothetical protein GX846_07735 [Deltaproteobacteria bacterium]|jgi:ribosomal protein L7Ae-like RNA K-turn-binding protein|nr:hypothetical protein [Deltaproteobacteria bacterium]